MAKRILKNKRLMRNILILAGFLIVGFFVWTTLFKNTKIFEGQQVQSITLDQVGSAITGCKGDKPCVIDKLQISPDDYDLASIRTITGNNSSGSLPANIISIMLDKQTPPPPSTSPPPPPPPPPPPRQQPSISDMVTKTVGEIVKKCRNETNSEPPHFQVCITNALVKEDIPNFTIKDTNAAIELKLANRETTTLIDNIAFTVMEKMGLQPQRPQGQPQQQQGQQQQPQGQQQQQQGQPPSFMPRFT